MKLTLMVSFCLLLTGVIAQAQLFDATTELPTSEGRSEAQLAEEKEASLRGLSPALKAKGQRHVRWGDPGHEIAVTTIQRARHQNA